MYKEFGLEEQMPHSDYRSRESGYIDYYSTTENEDAKAAYQPELGDGCGSMFICPYKTSDHLGVPGDSPYLLDGFSFSYLQGDFIHFGTGNHRSPGGIWKIFTHLDVRGYNRKERCKERDLVHLRNMMVTNIRSVRTPFRVVYSPPIFSYSCDGFDGVCSITSEHYTHETSHYMYPYCITCMREQYHVDLKCEMVTHGARVEPVYSAHYNGEQKLVTGTKLNFQMKGNIVTKESYAQLHPHLGKSMIQVIKLPPRTKDGEIDPTEYFLDCLNFKCFLMNWRHCSVRNRSSVEIDSFDFEEGVGILIVSNDIENGDEMVFFNEASKNDPSFYVEYDENCAAYINMTAGEEEGNAG